MADEENVVNVRVQVIDVKAFTLDLQVPTYLPSRDLTQRIARDAGLDAYWPDRTRRLYWLRARGRLMTEEERLSDLGVINGELVYLLPQPPKGSGVIEQTPEYPVTHDYPAAGWLTVIGSLFVVLAFAVGWGVAISYDRSFSVTLVPGFALGLFCCSLARHTWGGAGNALRIPVTALAVQMILTVLAFLPPLVFNDVPVVDVLKEGLPGLTTGMLGVFIGWLAWWGGVEPLPPVQVQQIEAAPVEVAVACGICGGVVEGAVRADCRHRCGQAFHQGCLRAKEAVYRGDKSKCAVCGRQVA